MGTAATEIMRFVDFGAGDTVMKESTLAEGLYILMSGTLEVSVKGVKVAEITGKGSYLGEIASILRCRRTATVKALTPAKFLVVDNVTRYFEENPSAALAIAQTLASRIMDVNQKIVSYQEDLKKWVARGEEAIKTQDIGIFNAMLDDMQKLLIEGTMGKPGVGGQK